jgi:SAM-dependent methyltransferase
MFSTIPENKTNCPVCDSQESVSLTASERMLGLGGTFSYLECLGCGSLRIESVPADLGKFYPSDYYSFKPEVPDSGFRQSLKRARYLISSSGVSLFDNEYLTWLKNLGTHEGEKIADIGCGSGVLLWQMFYCGFKNLYGFDPFLPQELDTPALKLKRLALEEVEAREGTFDVVMLHHCFEHLEDPKQAFSQIANLLKPGGRALLRLPVTDASVWKKEREYWFQLDAPRHLFIPSVRAMKAMGESVGLTLERLDFDSTGNQFWITESYKQGKNLIDIDPEKDFSRSQLRDFDRQAKILNQLQQGDQAAFYFKKSL